MPEVAISVVAGKVFREDLPRCLELLANEAQPHQPSPHRELFVFLLLLLGACAPHILCHLAHRKAKLNVALEFACVEPVLLAVHGRVELEKPKFHRALGEGRVQVQHVVAAVVVVVRSAVGASLRGVPDVRELCHRGGLFAVELLKEIRVDRSAILAHPAAVDLDRFGDQRFVARHDVRKVSQALRCVSRRTDVNMDSASEGVVALGARLAQAADQLLQGLDVCVGQDRGRHLAGLAVLRVDAAVAHKLPLAPLRVPCAPGAVAVAPCGVLVVVGAKELGGELCGSAAGDAGHLDLHPNGLLLHSCDLLCGLLSHFCILRFGFRKAVRLSLCHILPSFGEYSKPLNVQIISVYFRRISGKFTYLQDLHFYAILGYDGIGSHIFGSPQCCIRSAVGRQDDRPA